MKSILLAIALVLIGTSSKLIAQPFTDIVSLHYQYHLPAPYKDQTHVPGDKRSLEILTTDLLLPIALKRGSYLLTGGLFSSYQFHTLSDQAPTVSDYYIMLGVRGGILYQWKSEKDKTLLLVLPKWSSDKPYFRNEGFQIGGVVLHTHQISTDFAWKAGLYYNREFFGNFFMPLAGIDWRIKEDLWLYGTLPGNLQLHKMFSPSFAGSITYTSPSGSLLFENGGDYIRIGRSFPPISVISGDMHWTLMAPVTLRASIGHSIWRSYARYNNADNKYDSGIYADYKDGFMIQASIVVRVLNE